MLSRRRGKSNLIAADIEAAIDTGSFLDRNTSSTAQALWEDEYTHLQTELYRCSEAWRPTHRHTNRVPFVEKTCLLVVLAYTSPNILSKQTKRFAPDKVCVPSLQEKVFDDSINQTAEQGWHCKAHIIKLPLLSSLSENTPWKSPWIQPRHIYDKKLLPKALFLLQPCISEQPRPALNHIMCFYAAPEWDIDFKGGSFHHTIPATLSSIFQNHTGTVKAHAQHSMATERRIVIFALVIHALCWALRVACRMSWSIIA